MPRLLFYFIFAFIYTEQACANKIVLGIGKFNFRKSQDLEYRLEYRAALNHFLSPLAGIMLANKEAKFLYAGVSLYKDISESYRVNFTLTPGLYMKGHNKDLGRKFQIRTQIELWKIFSDRMEAGIAISHTSNAGLSEKNPGKESITFQWGINL